jgi:hypothetical protein
VLTHLSVQVCPCDVGTLTFQQGVVFGTTTARAIEMAREAGPSLSVVCHDLSLTIECRRDFNERHD